MKVDIKVNFHSSICINDKIFVDPIEINGRVKNVKLIFITHPHYDHFDIKSIKNLVSENTVIVCTKDCVNKLIEEGVNGGNIYYVEPNQHFELMGVKGETFSSYNTNKEFHKKEYGWVGYHLTIDGVKYTICGDSDLTEELKQIETDVLFVPIGGTYTMDAVDRAKLANIVKPKLVVPVHYGKIVGDKENVETAIKKLYNLNEGR